MNYAYCRFTNGAWDYVYVSDIISGKIRESDVVEWLCPSCKKRAFIRHPAARVLHVACYHTDTCDFVNDGNDHKIHKKVVDRKIDLDSILDFVDGPVRNRRGGGGQPGGDEEPSELLLKPSQTQSETKLLNLPSLTRSLSFIHSPLSTTNIVFELT